ncbi:hypothetical protein BH11PLA2_BH11PLA2_23030 [soil metagenome]
MDPDLQALLALWLGDQDPGESRRVELKNRLQTDDAFRQSFVAEIHLLGKLRAVQSAMPRWLRLEDEIGWSASPPIKEDELAARVVSAVRQRTKARKRIRWLGVAIAASVILGLFVANSLRVADPEHVAIKIVEPVIDLATVVQVEQLQWAGEGPAPVVGSIIAAGPFRMISGRMTLILFNGVSLTVEGPAELDLLAVNRLICNFGKIRVRVPRGAQGFTVLTERYEVVDMGTEFAVNREPGGKSQVMVFEGDAAVSLIGAKGQSVHGALLEKFQSVEVDSSDRIRTVTPAPDTFATLGKFVPAILELPPEYSAAVKASNPWGYWRFDSESGGKIPNEIPNRPALLALGGVHRELSGPGNWVARFLPNVPTQAFQLDGVWKPPHVSGYAIELWAQTDVTGPNSVGRNALVSVLDRREGTVERHMAYLELMGRGRFSPHEPCAIRFVDRWPPTKLGGVDLFSRRTIVPTLWRHIVGQKVGENLELYVDGELVMSSPAHTPSPGSNATTECLILVGRLTRNNAPQIDNNIRAFEGCLDELAVYDHPLSAEVIKQHAGLRNEVRP